MKNILLFVFIIITLIIPALACSAEKYADVKNVLNSMISHQEEFIESLESAKSSRDVVRATDIYGDKLSSYGSRVIKLKEKYEGISSWAENPPAQLKSIYLEIAENHKKLVSIISGPGFKEYLENPEVIRSFDNLVVKMRKAKSSK